MSAGLLPSWTEVPLDRLLREPLAAGRSGPAVPGGVPVLRLPALRSATVDLSESQEGMWASAAEAADRLIQPGDILMSRDGMPGARIGRAARVREATGPMTFPATMVRVRVDERLIDPEYLVLAWESSAVRRQIESSVRRGSGLHHIATRDLARVRLPLPPLAEQERIKTSLALWLARVDEEEAAVRATLMRIKDLRTLVIDHGIVGRTTPGPHAATEPSTASAHRPLPAVPAGWRWIPLGELADVVRGPILDSRRADKPHGVEVGSLRPAEFRGERWAHKRMPTVRMDADAAEANRLSPGDVLFVLSGRPDGIGLARVWEQDSPHRTYVPNHHVARVRMAGETLHPRLLALYTNGAGRGWLRGAARHTIGLASLGLDQLRRTPIPIPPLAEQGALLASLEAWDGGLSSVTASAEEALAMADQLRDGCREQALAGRLPHGAAPSSENDERPEGAVTVPPTTPARRPVDRPSEVERQAEQLWSSFPPLSDDGLTDLEYVEQVAYLLFLKVAQELRNRPLNRADVLGRDAWDELALLEGTDLTRHYGTLLAELGERGGVIGRIFHNARNTLRRPVHLQNLIQQVGAGLSWWDERPEWRAPVFDAFLARSGQRHRGGGGQYFTHRALVDAIVSCTRPTVEDTILDPAAGTGGFLVRSFEHIARHLPPGVSPTQRERLSHGAIRGTELVDATARLATMNLLLHGVERLDGDRAAIEVRDSLAVRPGRRRATLVLADPPLGQRRSAVPSTGAPGLPSTEEDLAIARPDFWAATSHQQLNFLQHVYTLLEIGGRAAVVVPDGVLFTGGAGEQVRRQLLKQCDVHTLLRLPVGFSGVSSGVKLNVLFFEKAAARPDGSPATRRLWVYDLRTGRGTADDAPDSPSSGLNAFVAAYRPGHAPDTRVASPDFKPYSADALLGRPGVNLDLGADLREEEPGDTPEPHLIAQQISERLEDAWRRFATLAEQLMPQRDARTFRSG
ncbi:N-6 DNA methylase [Streptomyces sp. NBC_00513]|uniref:N-6 DNA methylase n=1 Tax=unclassified Streptomyces TaxID=2593676 RepID=UPI0022512B11|nr:N-6 DNA methylase [Streptomyces sp. NBC_00424]MCX5072676.1 N-6 DNA methylase [Streptomyces sp. NBC_00424]WUD44007.1 N-6 DNA methylase [Streptomyces sp. NBC_00513]